MAPRPPSKIPEFTEVDYKTKAGVAWSHNYLNQKPWHPMSYPNQRRKWIAEQEHSVREQAKAIAAKEFAEEQEFFKEAALLNEDERKRIELAQAVSFMYQRPPGYNPEVDVKTEKPEEKAEEVKKARVKDVFGRSIATGEEFAALKDAPRMETGIVGKAKPFAVEIRNVKCARCGAFGHQSGDRDCPLRDALMPQEEARQKREDPLQKILATVPQEAPKWTLKDGGRSPPRGGFNATAENQQILPPDELELQMAAQADAAALEGQPIDESILAQLSRSERKALLRAYKRSNGSGDEKSRDRKRRKKHRRRKKQSSSSSEESSDSGRDRKERRKRGRRKVRDGSDESAESDDGERRGRRRRKKRGSSSESEEVEVGRKHRSHRRKRELSLSADRYRGDDLEGKRGKETRDGRRASDGGKDAVLGDRKRGERGREGHVEREEKGRERNGKNGDKEVRDGRDTDHVRKGRDRSDEERQERKHDSREHPEDALIEDGRHDRDRRYDRRRTSK